MVELVHHLVDAAVQQVGLDQTVEVVSTDIHS